MLKIERLITPSASKDANLSGAVHTLVGMDAIHRDCDKFQNWTHETHEVQQSQKQCPATKED